MCTELRSSIGSHKGNSCAVASQGSVLGLPCRVARNLTVPAAASIEVAVLSHPPLSHHHLAGLWVYVFHDRLSVCAWSTTKHRSIPDTGVDSAPLIVGHLHQENFLDLESSYGTPQAS